MLLQVMLADHGLGANCKATFFRPGARILVLYATGWKRRMCPKNWHEASQKPDKTSQMKFFFFFTSFILLLPIYPPGEHHTIPYPFGSQPTSTEAMPSRSTVPQLQPRLLLQQQQNLTLAQRSVTSRGRFGPSPTLPVQARLQTF